MGKTGLEIRLQEILKSNADDIERFKDTRNSLRNKERFCREHKFDEEGRITLIKLEQMEMLFYNYECMFNDINDALDKWNSDEPSHEEQN